MTFLLISDQTNMLNQRTVVWQCEQCGAKIVELAFLYKQLEPKKEMPCKECEVKPEITHQDKAMKDKPKIEIFEDGWEIGPINGKKLTDTLDKMLSDPEMSALIDQLDEILKQPDCDL